MVDALADKPNVNWEDGSFTLPALQQKRREHRYSTQAVGAGSLAGSVTLPSACSSAPAFKHGSSVWMPGPNPSAGDRLYAVTDNGNFVTLDPGTMVQVGSPITGVGTYSKSAVAISGDNTRAYLLTTTGRLAIIDLTNNTVIYNAIIGTNFSGMAPVLDYGSNQSGGSTIFGSIEDLIAVNTDGSIQRVHIDASGGNASMTVTKTSYSAASLYGASLTVTSWALAWEGHVYFGDTNGKFYDVDLSAGPAVKSWSLGGYTSSTAKAISAPPALDMDPNNGLAVSAIFVPCGDRVDWIDPTQPTTATSAVVSSPSLTLDRALTPVVNTLSNYTPSPITAQTPLQAEDWASIAKLGSSSPTRWGGGAAPVPVTSTGTVATSVRLAPNKSEIWITDNANSKISRYDLTGTLLQSVTLQAGANKGPIKLEFDKNGNCWASCGAIPAGGWVEKINGTMTRVWAANNTIPGALYIAPDANGDCWVSDFANQKVYHMSAAGVAGPAISLAGATTVYCDPTDPSCVAWVTNFLSNRVYRVLPNGTSTTITVGTNPIYCAFDPLTNNVWITNNGSSNITILNRAGTLQSTLATTARPWALSFETDGTPWLTHQTYGSTAGPNIVEQLNRTCTAPPTTYPMASNPNEVAIDPNGTVWVATQTGLVKIQDIGETRDLFGSSYRVTSGDGNDSYAFMRFKIASGAYANQAVTSAYLGLTPASTTACVPDTVQAFRAASTISAPAGLWTGYKATPNVDWNNRPWVDSAPFFSSSIALTSGTQIGTPTALPAIPVPLPADQPNTPYDAANAYYTFAVNTSGKKLGDVGHFFSKTLAGAATKEPNLYVNLATGAVMPATSIQCQPAIDPDNHKVWVVASDALFELDYSSASQYTSRSATYYNETNAGRTTGTTTSTAPKKYLFPKGNVLVTENGRLLVPDFNASGNTQFLNDFNINLASGVDRLAYQLDIGTKGNLNQAMIYDYAGGSAYMTTTSGGTNYALRANILQ